MFEILLGLVRVVNQVIHQTTIHVHHKTHQEKTELAMFVRVRHHGQREVVRQMRQVVRHVKL